MSASDALAVPVVAGLSRYDVLIGRGLLTRLAELWRPEGTKVVVVSDENVAPHYLATVVDGLAGAANVSSIVVAAGERQKTPATLARLYDGLYDRGLGRDDAVVALGGGVVGDMAGYAAATFLRGLRLVQAPTSLLAMVDAAVGGKVAVDFREGKNYLGTFYQPELVVEDLDTLVTLSSRDVRNGWAEMLKDGFLAGGDVLDDTERALAGGGLPGPALVAASVRLKAGVVGRDERERGGERAVLNLGHTVGHAVEVAGGYERYSHGEAVGLGLRAALWLSERTGRLDGADGARGQRLIDLAGLPARLEGCAPDDVVRLAGRDKKAVRGRPRYVLLEGFGRPVTGVEIEPELEREAVRWLTTR